MEILQIIGIGLLSAILAVVVKKDKPEYAIHISIAAGLIIFIFILGKLATVINVFNNIANKASIDSTYLNIILKIIGISYLVEFGSQICKDSGENAIASKIEIAGKVIILVLSIPILQTLLDLVIKILS